MRLPQTPLELLVCNIIQTCRGYISKHSKFTNTLKAIDSLIKFIGYDEGSGKYHNDGKTAENINAYLKNEFTTEAMKDDGMFQTANLPGELIAIYANWQKTYLTAAVTVVPADAKAAPPPATPAVAAVPDSKQAAEVADLKKQIADLQHALDDAKAEPKIVPPGSLKAKDLISAGEGVQLKAQLATTNATLATVQTQLTAASAALLAAEQTIRERDALLKQKDEALRKQIETAASLANTVAEDAKARARRNSDAASTKSSGTDYKSVVEKLCSLKRTAIFIDLVDTYDRPQGDEKLTDQQSLQKLHDDLLLHTCVKTKRNIPTDAIIEDWKRMATEKATAKVADVVVKYADKDDRMPELGDEAFSDDPQSLASGVRNALKKEPHKRNFIIPNKQLSNDIKAQNANGGFAVPALPTPRGGTGSRRPSTSTVPSAGLVAAAAAASRASASAPTVAAPLPVPSPSS